MVIIPFDSDVLMTAGPTNAPGNCGVMTTSLGAATILPRAELAVTLTLAVWLICSAHSVPLEGGKAAGTVGSHKAPNSSVTALELSPDCVPPGLSSGTASGL